MNILVVLGVAAVFGILRYFRANLLTWAVAWWVGIFVLLRFGFIAPIPSSVIKIYMGIVSLAILAYMSSSRERREEVSRPLVRFMTEKRFLPFLAAAVVALPVLAAGSAGMATTVAPRSAVYRLSVMNRTRGRETSSRRSWLEDIYARIAIETIPM